MKNIASLVIVFFGAIFFVSYSFADRYCDLTHSQTCVNAIIQDLEKHGWKFGTGVNLRVLQHSSNNQLTGIAVVNPDGSTQNLTGSQLYNLVDAYHGRIHSGWAEQWNEPRAMDIAYMLARGGSLVFEPAQQLSPKTNVTTTKHNKIPTKPDPVTPSGKTSSASKIKSALHSTPPPNYSVSAPSPAGGTVNHQNINQYFISPKAGDLHDQGFHAFFIDSNENIWKCALSGLGQRKSIDQDGRNLIHGHAETIGFITQVMRDIPGRHDFRRNCLISVN